MAELVLTSHLHLMAVVALDTKQRLGFVKKTLVSAKDGRVVGLAVATNLFTRPKVIVMEDIHSVEKEIIIVRRAEDLVDIDDVVRIQKLWREKAFLGNNLVLTQSGKRLGRLFDLAVSLTHGILTRLYIKSFLRDRIIPARNIIKVEKRKIIVKDKTKKVIAGLLEYSK